MAEAFMADRRDQPDPTFVLKRMRPDFARVEAYERRFVFEAQVASRVVHRNLARFREFGRVGQCFYLAMDRVRGRSLHRILERIFRKGIVPPLPVAVHLGVGVLQGLSALHSVTDEEGHLRPILHRDVTPKNVLVDLEGESVLIDFGIAKDVYGPAITQPGQVVGTARYMAPEHRRAEFLDARADVFSASVILFELFTGTHPWPPQQSVRELLCTVFDPPVLSDEVRARVPESMLQVLLQGLECDAERRFEDAGAMARALAEAGAVDRDEGPQQVVEWIDSLGVSLDEELAEPVIDHMPAEGSGSADVRVFWTSSGFVSSDGSAPDARAGPAALAEGDAQVLAVPPLPPRRDASLGGQRTEDMVQHLRRGRMRRAAAVALGLLGLVALVGLGLVLGGRPGD